MLCARGGPAPPLLARAPRTTPALPRSGGGGGGGAFHRARRKRVVAKSVHPAPYFLDPAPPALPHGAGSGGGLGHAQLLPTNQTRPSPVVTRTRTSRPRGRGLRVVADAFHPSYLEFDPSKAVLGPAPAFALPRGARPRTSRPRGRGSRVVANAFELDFDPSTYLEQALGRGLHSSTSQLNFNSF